MYDFFILEILITILLIAQTIYLLYARHSPAIVERKLKKYEAGTREYNLLKKIHTRNFLAIVVIATLSFALDLGIDIFGLVRGFIPLPLKTFGFIIGMASSLAVIYLVYILFWERDKSNKQ